MLSRRQFFKKALCAGLASPNLALASFGRKDWTFWVDTYLAGGRAFDPQQGFTHSEGQGYALLLAQAFGDHDLFQEIENWTARHLAVREDGLMAWKWLPGPSNNIADWHNATDGDLFRAWALLRAERDSGWSGYRETAVAIARDIADLCLVPDPRAPAEWLLVPGAEARRSDDRVLFNPSYIMPHALRELGQAASEPRLIRAADHGGTVLAELAATGFLPNWVDITREGFAKPAEHEDRWGYDALRIPLYLSWSGQTRHPAVQLALQIMEQASLPGHLIVEASPDGRFLAQSNRTGFRAVHALARCAELPDPTLSDRDYYADSLLMLTHIAKREGACRP